MDYKEYAKELVEKRDDIIAAYGYGSAFSHQQGYTKDIKKSMDLIFVVDNLKKWNNHNFQLNKNDYSKYTKAIFKLMPKFLLKSGSSIIYNVVTDRYDVDFKYGLIEKNDLLSDLYSWNHMYVNGRMQKPLYPIKKDSDIEEAIKYNRKCALMIALIILNKKIMNVQELLEMICKLSYDGDVRTLFAENPNKIMNIVKGSYDDLKRIYCNNDYVKIYNDIAYVNLDKVYDNLDKLPKRFKNFNIKENYNYLSKVIRHMNLKESMIHPVKQFMVSGYGTCRKYMSEKMKKKTLK